MSYVVVAHTTNDHFASFSPSLKLQTGCSFTPFLRPSPPPSTNPSAPSKIPQKGDYFSSILCICYNVSGGEDLLRQLFQSSPVCQQHPPERREITAFTPTLISSIYPIPSVFPRERERLFVLAIRYTLSPLPPPLALLTLHQHSRPVCLCVTQTISGGSSKR